MRWLALRVPALYKDEDWDMPKRRLDRDDLARLPPTAIVPPTENRALAACAAFRGDVLIVESEHDDMVPHPVIANYLAAFAHGAFADLPGDRRAPTTRCPRSPGSRPTRRCWWPG